MLQIKNTLGGGKPEGLYAWKKYEKIGTYRYSLKSSIVTCVVGRSSDKFTITLDSSNCDGDLSYLDVKNLCKWLDGSLGIVRNSKRQICSWNGGDYLTFADHDDSSVTRYVYPSINNNIVTVTLYAFEDKSYTWNGLTKNTSFSSSIENAFEYYDYDYAYKGYIVSDKETAYPDGGEKGGYWYEKISNLKFTFGTFTPTSNQKETTIVHGLNDKIRFFGIYTEHIKPTENNLYQVEALSLHRGITYTSNGTSIENYNGRVSTTYVLTSGPYWYDQGFKISSLYGIGDVTESSITIFKNNHATNDTSSGSTDAPYFIGGRVHKWIAIADWEV